jgi:hypothetical protein
MDCRNEEHKYDILVSLYSLLTIGQSIIFCQVSSDYQNTTIVLKIDVAPAYRGQNFCANDCGGS